MSLPLPGDDQRMTKDHQTIYGHGWAKGRNPMRENDVSFRQIRMLLFQASLPHVTDVRRTADIKIAGRKKGVD
jgi:hypothetical protein